MIGRVPKVGVKSGGNGEKERESERGGMESKMKKEEKDGGRKRWDEVKGARDTTSYGQTPYSLWRMSPR